MQNLLSTFKYKYCSIGVFKNIAHSLMLYILVSISPTVEYVKKWWRNVLFSHPNEDIPLMQSSLEETM